MTTVLITGSGGPLGANVTRCLARAPETLRLIGTEANRWHLPLSLCERTYRIPYARDRAAYARALGEVIAREKVDVVIPTHPVEVRAVAEISAERAATGAEWSAGLALPRVEVLDYCDDKVVTHGRLRDAGVPVPFTAILERPEDIDAVFERLGGQSGDGVDPVWVRGTGAPGLGIGGAALPCRDPIVARAWVEHHRGWGGMAASEYLPGANQTWMACFAGGRLIASGARERLEYVIAHVAPSGVTGAPAVSRTVRRPELADIGERAVRAVDSRPHGVYFVDFKEDRAGDPRVTEINAGRCGTTVEAYREAGCNFPWLLVQIARGDSLEALEPPDGAVEPDVYWVRTLDCGPVAVRGDSGFAGYPSAGLAESEPGGESR